MSHSIGILDVPELLHESPWSMASLSEALASDSLSTSSVVAAGSIDDTRSGGSSCDPMHNFKLI